MLQSEAAPVVDHTKNNASNSFSIVAYISVAALQRACFA
jgi:hypothetical protein